MNLYYFMFRALLTVFLINAFSTTASAWYDQTHIAVAKTAGYAKWYNAVGADMLKLKAGDIEGPNHYANNPPGTVVTAAIVFAQVQKYDQIDTRGHLYGAIVAAMRNFLRQQNQGKYGGYHLAFCAHYVADLSMPLHNTRYDSFNRQNHQTIEASIDENILNQLYRIKIYPIMIQSEKDLVREIVRIANLSIKLGYEIEARNRLLTEAEIYTQLGHSASLFKAILDYVKRQVPP